MEREEIERILEEKYIEKKEKYKYNFNENKFDEISMKLVESSKHFTKTFDYDFGKGTTISQKIKIFIKRIIRKSTRFMLQPYADRMHRFQELNGEITGELTEYAKYSNNLLKFSQSEVNNKFNEVNNKFNEVNNKLINFESTLWNIIKEKNKVQEELSKYESYSQTGEDKIIEFILSYLGKENRGLSYLDIGCNDYKNLSNTYSLYRKGIRGVLIDANPIFVGDIKIYRPEDTILNLGVGSKNSDNMKFYILNTSGLSSFDLKSIEEAKKKTPWIEIVKEVEVPVRTLDEIYKEYFATIPTIVSIDVEGVELDILKSSNFEINRPLIFVIETIEYSEKLSIVNKRNDIIDFMKEKDYVEYAFTGVNSIFVDGRKL